MSCVFDTPLLERVIAFHGHRCPGLMIGIRVAELALQQLAPQAYAERTIVEGTQSKPPSSESTASSPKDTAFQPIDMVAIVETDMCGVDAIQFLTGCTYGKGNLIHQDYGKMAFSFFDRNTGKGFRAVLRPETRTNLDSKIKPLMQKKQQGTASENEEKQLMLLRHQLEEHFYSLPLDAMFTVETINVAPRPAQILQSLPCAHCGEMTMESRTRRFGGQTLCIPCFRKVEQKI